MTEGELVILLERLIKQSRESEWVEFKLNYYSAEEIGQMLSGLSNGACLEGQPCGYLVFGVKNDNNADGQEKTLDTVKLAKMNIAVNGLSGDIRQSNTYYEDPHDSFGRFDYVLANPPFNVDDVNLGKVEQDRRFNIYGILRNKSKTKKKGEDTCPNGNYLWFNLFATSLKKDEGAALVMANSASDARHSEADIRRNLIESNLIYGMLTLPSNMFYTITLPATLWSFDKAKTGSLVF